MKVEVGIPDPKNVECHPGGDDGILRGEGGVVPRFSPHSIQQLLFLFAEKEASSWCSTYPYLDVPGS